jgi:hypothetical protein
VRFNFFAAVIFAFYPMARAKPTQQHQTAVRG